MTGTAWAQTGTTALSGDVTDPQGAVISGATVTLTHPASGVSRTVTTDASGRYQFVGLRPGNYRLRVEASGFRTAVQENINLLVDTPSRVGVAMQVGTAAEVVEVVGAAAAVNTQDAAVGNAITAAQVRNLPVEGGSVVHLLSLQPGAVFLPQPAANDPRSGSIAGARADQQNVTLDGVDVNDPVFGTAYTSVLRQTPDSVQEFKVTTSSYGADQGRSSGSQVSLVTRQGSNELHGSAYWSHRNTVFSSNEYFFKNSQLQQGNPNKQPVLQKHIYGASAGGPIVRDRLFIFGNWHVLREKRQFSAFRDVPSETLRDGVLSYVCAVPANCPGGSVQGFTNTHTIAPGRFGLTPAQLAAIDPLGIGPSVAASTFFKQYPSPNDPGSDGINLMGFRFGGDIANKLNTYIARVDYKLDAPGNHTLFVRGNLQNDTENGSPQFPDSPGPNSAIKRNNKGIGVGYTGVLSPRLVNNFRYGFTRIGESTSGLRDSHLTTFRFLSHYPYDTASFTSARSAPTHNFVNDISYIRGNHTIQAGVNLRFTRIPRFSNNISFHTAIANGSWVSGVGRTYVPGGASCTTPGCGAVPAVASTGVASYADSLINILGIISQASARYNYDRTGTPLPAGDPVRRRYGSNEYEWYIQDSWRMHPTFTFTAGVRWGYFSPPWETDGLQVCPTVNMGERFTQRAINMASGVPASAAPPVDFDLCGPANNRPHFYEKDFNNWAPRVSFAWNPQTRDGIIGALSGGGQTVVRGGFSMVYDRIGQALALSFDQGGSFGMSTSLTSPFGTRNEDDPTIRFVNVNTLPPHLPAAPPGGFPATPPSDAGIITQTLDGSIRTPYSLVYNLTIGREMPWNSSLEVGYVGRAGRKLLIRRDLAMPLNLTDPASGMDYFSAARMAIDAIQGITSSAAANFAGIPNIPYFENMWPTAGAAAGLGLTNTQTIARRLWIDEPDYITSLWLYDQICPTATRPCSKLGPFAFFDPQYDFVAASSSVASSQYHGMQVSWRKRPSQGLQFDVNYALSKSMDHGSSVERGFTTGTNFANGGYTGFLLNPFDMRQHYAQSDFDVRQQINVNWIWDVPFGRGRSWAADAGGPLDAIIGGWQLSGIWRQTSGFPMNVFNCRSCWATNWNLQGNAGVFNGQIPEMARTHNVVSGSPSPFKDPALAVTQFRRSYPGEVGLRNAMRGDGYFAVDMGIGKSWTMPYAEGHSLNFRWDIFNISNSARFDVSGMDTFPDRPNFGRYNQTLATCDRAAGRCMQFGFRYNF